MTLRPFYNHVKRTVHVKIFNLHKIRWYFSEHAAIMLYKHMILPSMEYAGFMLLSYNLEEKRELQRYQNDALRICTRIKIADHVRIEDLHTKCNIICLEQRRRIQLLLLIYKKSKDLSLKKVFPRNMRASNQFVFKTDHYEGTLYKRSPYFLGAKLWDNLPVLLTEVPCIFKFK